LAQALELTLYQRELRARSLWPHKQVDLHREMRQQAARMDAAHALLESRPDRQHRRAASGTRARAVASVRASRHGSPPRGSMVHVHRVLGQVWRNGRACVRASLVDGSIHIVPVELVEPSMLLTFTTTASKR
jgi:hypothetical protein